MRAIFLSPVAFAVCALVRVGVFAQDDDQGDEAPRPFVVAVRVREGPRIDGRLTDEVWTLATEAGRMKQVEPVAGAIPTERTEVRVVYDDSAIYFAATCHDSRPGEIRARMMERDARLRKDDSFALALDTFHDGRNGYLFATNPNGAKSDFLIADNADLSEEWDGIWEVSATIDEKGWRAEFAIPFDTLGFDPNIETWGFNFERGIKRNSERMRWAGVAQHHRVHNVKEAGELRGLRGLRQGLGIELSPYVLSTFRDERAAGDTDLLADFGGEVRYRITPNLAASLSYNTDFAQTEVDVRQLNLTRFPLLFPEKRDFFLEDSSIFRFGRFGRTGRFLGPGGRNQIGSEPIPYFSRRIGLGTDGSPHDIVVAGKVAGRSGSYNLGLIDALIERHDGLPMRNAFVGRVSRNILEQSQIGVIATHGDPNSRDDSFLAGGDVNLRTSEFLGDKVLQTGLFALGTWSEGAAGRDNLSFGSSVELPNDEYRASLRFFQVDEGFRPSLGFVPRDAVRAYEGFFAYNPRPRSIEWLRQMFFAYETSYFTDLEDDLETVEHRIHPLFLFFESGDYIFATAQYELDAPRENFEISDGVVIEPDHYWWPTYRVGVNTASKRPVELELAGFLGGFYDGDRDGIEVELTLRPIRYLSVDLEYEINRVKMPQGDFDTRLASVNTRVSFSPTINWFHLVQYDNVSDSVGYQSRFHWEFRPGGDVYVVLGQNIARNHGRARWVESELSVKVGATFRF